MPTELESRFLSFLSKLPNSESLDTLLSNPRYDGQRRADYLLFDRKIILELKSLESDPSYKIESEIDKHRERDDFPLMYGIVDLQSMLKHLPDGKDINARIFYKTTRSIEDAVRSAEEQIENTAELLQLPNAAGLLVLLNQSLGVLTPEVVAHRVAELIRRKKEDGKPRSPIVFALLILESHELTQGPTQLSLPLITIEGAQSPDKPWFKELLNYLLTAWAQFNGIPLLQQGASNIDVLKSRERSDRKQAEQKDTLTKQEFWEARYTAQPYLRHRTDAEVLSFGREACKRFADYMKTGDAKHSPAGIEKWIVPWSDFLCEARYRGLDLRGLGKI